MHFNLGHKWAAGKSQQANLYDLPQNPKAKHHNHQRYHQYRNLGMGLVARMADKVQILICIKAFLEGRKSNLPDF